MFAKGTLALSACLLFDIYLHGLVPYLNFKIPLLHLYVINHRALALGICSDSVCLAAAAVSAGVCSLPIATLGGLALPSIEKSCTLLLRLIAADLLPLAAALRCLGVRSVCWMMIWSGGKQRTLVHTGL